MEEQVVSWCMLVLLLVGHGVVAGQGVESFLSDKEEKVMLLGRHALFLQLAAESTDCGLSNCVDKCSRHSCSPTAKDKFTCIKAPNELQDCKSNSRNSSAKCDHLKVDFTGNGFVRVPPQFHNFSDLSPELTRAICAQSNLQFSASSDSIFSELTFWNYFGSAEGAWRIYPGREADPETGCVEYDPRKRPWYITAVSVVKDLVVLLDAAQLDTSTFTHSKTVIQELFGTFRPGDRVNLVTFSSASASLLQSISAAVEMNYTQAALLSGFDLASVRNGQGFSNITSGFEKARSTFNATSKLKIILVLTDGNFVKNPAYNDPALNQSVHSLSSEGIVVFFFTLGASSAPDPLTELRTLSCRMNGTVTYVPVLDAERNPLWAIRPFFDYQAGLRFASNRTFWTDPYEDFDGLGHVATVTYLVFNEGILHGVAGIDVIVNMDSAEAIKRRLVDPNVATVPLTCQMNQVNLSRCTKPVEAHDQALCPQTLDRNQRPRVTYLKNLCCDSCAFQDPPPRDITNLLLACIIPGPVVLIAILVAYFLLRKRAARHSIRETKEDFARQAISTNQYTYKELKSATLKFHQDNKLGEGGFGEVYKCCLQGTFKDGTVVAVKKLSANSKQGAREFLNEVIVISRVQHRNLVKLRGCCVEKQHRLLVYEYLENRSLRQSLLGGPKEALDIDWSKRFNIALGTARGLAYLHFEVTPRIIHRDIKASNVLLNRNLEAKIADFGLAKLFPEEQSHFTTNVAGTLGYVAPEYVTRGILTEKVDIYSFGVVLMEIITGEVNMKRTPSGSLLFLVDRVRCKYKQAQAVHDDQVLLELVDSRLEGNFERDQALQVLKTALLCTFDNPDLRPTAPMAILMLLGNEAIQESDLEPVVNLEYSHTQVEFGETEVWSDTHPPTSMPSSRV